MPANMQNLRVNLNGIARITEEDANRLKKHLVKCGDIVYSRRGDVTQKALISKNEEGYFCGTGCLLIRPGDEVDSTFLVNYLSTPVNQSWIVQQAVGATMPNLNTGILDRVPLALPPLSDQKKIAKALSTLDAKIELNNRINAELEAMAKLLYDYWFVQFDFPMSADQATALGQPELEGKPYKASGGKMVFNPTLKRDIPEGWEDGELSDIAQIVMGQSPPGETYNLTGEGTLFFQGSTDFGWRFPTARQFTTQPTRHSKEGDILLSVRAPVGTMNVAPFNCAIGRGLAALRSKSNHDTYLFSVMGYFKQIFDRRNGDGTTFGSINKDDLHSLQVVLPDSKIIESFEGKVRSGNTMIANNQKQNQELTELRDWLLPMLMNGQVSVS
jgi:type I restriction enzyme S subunit